jgi:hypothetical protein
VEELTINCQILIVPLRAVESLIEIGYHSSVLP